MRRDDGARDRACLEVMEWCVRLLIVLALEEINGVVLTHRTLLYQAFLHLLYGLVPQGHDR